MLGKTFCERDPYLASLLQVNIIVDEGIGLPVIVPVRQGAAGGGGGSAEERKNQVSAANPLQHLT